MTTWTPDILGAPWVARTLDLPGREATLVRYNDFPGPDEETELPRRAIVYIHGFSDYFFQSHLGPIAAAQGYQFYAVDLPAYGRSLRPGQIKNYTTDLAEYRDCLDRAIAEVRGEDDHEDVVLMGHSTGGLISALWAHARRGKGLVDAVVLNSPWLDMHLPEPKRTAAHILIPLLARFAPHTKVAMLSGPYGKWLRAADGGGWDFNGDWKSVDPNPVFAGFLAAVLRGQNTLAKGLALDVPVLMCTSAESSTVDTFTGDSDSVLLVRQMWKRLDRLGPDVSLRKIKGGVHDLALSRPGPRQAYLTNVFDWLASRLG